ncbi:MAG: hypothetical protein KF723_14390 [Rhizobiaceae bacterium]|nr:hypothetical protein [Rhizobiaceae bacterium]
MIGGLGRIVDNLLGRGEAAVTVPPLDGALRPNRLLDEGTTRTPLDGVDCLAVQGGTLLAAAGDGIFVHGADGRWIRRSTWPSPIACIASIGADGLAVALASGDIVVEGGRFDGRRYRADGASACITAVAATGSHLFVANGSATNGPGDWQRDLLERNAQGSLWRIDLDGGSVERVADRLAWPAGIAVQGGNVVVSEAWNHRLIAIDPAQPGKRQVLHADLPAYPGRIAPDADGYWLALFAPRSQLVEFVLREPAYRRRMMAEVPQPYWVAPNLRSGRSFYESLQGGGVKHLGMLKPWAPTMSAGLCARLDGAFQPRASLQSRADGSTHGITSVVQHEGMVFAAARGDGVIVSRPAATSGADQGAGR